MQRIGAGLLFFYLLQCPYIVDALIRAMPTQISFCITGILVNLVANQIVLNYYENASYRVLNGQRNIELLPNQLFTSLTPFLSSFSYAHFSLSHTHQERMASPPTFTRNTATPLPPSHIAPALSPLTPFIRSCPPPTTQSSTIGPSAQVGVHRAPQPLGC